MINTRFWDDNYIVELKPEEKLLFLYLITNALTDICGIYEVSEKRIAYDTGIDSLSIQKILSKFQRDDKIKYVNGWICIKNFQKHQRTKSSKIKAGIKRSLSQIPEEVKKGIDRLSIALDKPEPKPEPKPKPKPKDSEQSSRSPIPDSLKGKITTEDKYTPAEVSRKFFENQEDIISQLKEKGLDENIIRREIKKFVSYWTEPNKSGTRVRWELQQTFDVPRRLSTWFGRIKDFNKKPKITFHE